LADLAGLFQIDLLSRHDDGAVLTNTAFIEEPLEPPRIHYWAAITNSNCV